MQSIEFLKLKETDYLGCLNFFRKGTAHFISHSLPASLLSLCTCRLDEADDKIARLQTDFNMARSDARGRDTAISGKGKVGMSADMLQERYCIFSSLLHVLVLVQTCYN